MSSTVSSNQEYSSEVLHGSPQSIGDDSSDDAVKTKPKCLIVCTGSVATLKVPELVVELSEHFDVMVACTGNSCFFLEKSMTYNPDAWNKFELLGGWNLVLKDEDEWNMWNMIGNSVLHIEMRRWADVIVVAPASANVLSKAAFGITDNFVLSIMRAWDFEKPCILCPAMNTFMWTHPTTKESIGRLKAFGWEVLGPVEKLLACNEVGNGAMVSVQAIKDRLVAEFFPAPTEGKTKTTTGDPIGSSRGALLTSRGSDHDCDTTAETSATSKNSLQGSTTCTTTASPTTTTFSRRATKELLQLPTNSFLARNIIPGGLPVTTGPVHHSLLMPLTSQTSSKAVSLPSIPTAQTSRGLSGSRVSSSDGKGLSLNTLLLSNLVTGVGIGLGLAGGVLLYGALTGERTTDIVPRSLFGWRASIPRYSI